MPIQNLHNSGEFRKYVNVVTNAKNNASFKLSMAGNYRPLFELEPNNLRLSSKKDKDSGEVITIKTARKDLKIIDVQFKENGKDLDWKAYVPIKFSMVAVDTVKPKKDTTKKASIKIKTTATTAEHTEETLNYKLRVSYIPSSKNDLYGEFVIKTNLKENPEIKISGVLEAKKE